jgi:hypothetical protein
MRRLVALVLLVAGCRSAEPSSVREPDPPQPTCDAEHVAIGEVCIPKFDRCGEGEISGRGGGCNAIGPTCGSSFVPDAEGCSPILPKEPCADGYLAIPGRGACEAIASCATASVGDWYVDAAFVGVSDGSASAPFRTIGEALAVATDDQTIAVGDGRYAEDVRITRRVSLLGRCPEAVELHGTTNALTIVADATVSGLAVTSAASGIVVASGSAKLRALEVRDVGSVGIEVSGGLADLSRSSVRRAHSAGIALTGGKLALDQAMVSDVGAEGIVVERDVPGSGVDLRELVVEKTKGDGIRLAAAADLTVSESVVRDAGGVGITGPSVPTMLSSLHLRRVTIERATGGGILVDGTSVDIVDGTIRDVGGAGITVKHAFAQVTGTIVDRAVGRGLAFTESQASVLRTIVRATELAGDEGYGLYAEGTTERFGFSEVVIGTSSFRDHPRGGVLLRKISLQASDLLVERCGRVGIEALSTAATIGEAIVRDTTPIDGKGGIGILSTPDDDALTAFSLTNVLVERNATAGVAIFDSASALHNVHVTDTAGIGVSFAPSNKPLTVDGLVVERNRVAGIFVTGVPNLRNVLVRDTRADDQARFGDGVVVVAPKTSGPRPVLDLIDVVSESNARAGLALFGLDVRMANTHARCNAVDIDVEPLEGVQTTIEDHDGNGCTCGGEPLACVAQSAGLSPSPPLAL